MSGTWNANLLTAVYDGFIHPFGIVDGFYDNDQHIIAGQSRFHGPLNGVPDDEAHDYFYELVLPLSGDFTVTSIDVSVEWRRELEGGDDVTLEVLHDDLRLNGAIESDGTALTTDSGNITISGLNLKTGQLIIRGRLDDNIYTDIDYLRLTQLNLSGTGTKPFVPMAQQETIQEGGGDACHMGIHGNRSHPFTSNPISLKTGDKREQITDLRLQTATGELAFKRYYRQSRLTDPLPTAMQVMGPGWSHNHNIRLVHNQAGITVYLPNNGKGIFNQDVSDPTLFRAAPGGTSAVTLAGDGTYTLDNQQGQIFKFDSNGRLTTHIWDSDQNQRRRNYSYNTAGQLTTVTEESSGVPREFQLSYDGAGRIIGVQDHTGRSVTFTYDIADRLHTVTDVRGEQWTYLYDSLNRLVEYQAPLKNGNRQVLKRLIHNITSDGHPHIIEERGIVNNADALKRTDYVFREGTTEEILGYSLVTDHPNRQVTTYQFENGVLAATIDAAGQETRQETDANYRVRAKTDANGNQSRIIWDAAGRTVQEVEDAENNQTKLAYLRDGSYRLSRSTDVSGLQTLYLYEDQRPANRRQPTKKIQARNENLVLNADGDSLTGWQPVSGQEPAYFGQAPREKSSNKPIRYVTGRNTSDSSSGSLRSVGDYKLTNGIDEVRGRISFDIYVLKGRVSVGFNNGISQFYTPTSVWTSEVFEFSIPGQTHVRDKISFNFTGGTQFYITNVQFEDITNTPPQFVIPQTLEWTVSNGYVEMSDDMAFAPPDVLHSLSDSVNEGFEQSIAVEVGKTYVVSAYVRPLQGSVRMSLDDVSVVSEVDSTTWQPLSLFYTADANGSVPLRFSANSLGPVDADFFVDNVIVYEVANPVYQEFEYNIDGQVTVEELKVAETGTVRQSTSRTYGTTGNEAGLLKTVTRQNSISSDFEALTYTYDELGQVIKRARQTLTGECCYTYTVYDAAGAVTGQAEAYVNVTPPATVSGLLALYDATDTKRQHTTVATYEYDEQGRHTLTTRNAHLGVDARLTYTVHDVLGRLTHTVENYDNNNSYDNPATWYYAGNGEWRDSSNQIIDHGERHDRNIVHRMDYNSRGQIWREYDVEGRVTLYGYDILNRLVRTIQSASQPDYDASFTTGDPSLAQYPVDETVSDKDIVTTQNYDAADNLIRRVDARQTVTLYGYDKLNRLVKTVRAARERDYPDVTDDTELRDYVPVTAPDQDIITETIYDASGRIEEVRQLRDNRLEPDWDITRSVYDELGREIRRITHYVEQATSPDQWVWDELAPSPKIPRLLSGFSRIHS